MEERLHVCCYSQLHNYCILLLFVTAGYFPPALSVDIQNSYKHFTLKCSRMELQTKWFVLIIIIMMSAVKEKHFLL